MTVIYLLRDDLRLADNPALVAAAKRGPVIPLFVLDPGVTDTRVLGGAARWWLHHSLSSLNQSLVQRGSRLVCRRGDTLRTVLALAEDVGAEGVYLARGYAPWDVLLETRLHDELVQQSRVLRRFSGRLLFEPEAVTTRSGGPFKVFTPFWRACLASAEPHGPVDGPAQLVPPDVWPTSLTPDQLGLLPTGVDWTRGLARAWTPGEVGAGNRLFAFLSGAADGYADGRDFPAAPGTSRLSPHLRWGEISPRSVWHALETVHRQGGEAFRRQLGWRDFAQHLIFHFPDLPDKPLQTAFDAVPWGDGAGVLDLWQRGRTGYPIVDAGMRELWQTGWMHNRVRMIAASFLVKHLLVDWRHGARWFMDTLVDADPANNSAGWQWVAGCGTDAAPYFRVFNPVLQGNRFDPAGEYVRRWVPELARLPDTVLQQPWHAAPPILGNAGVSLGTDYPKPLVEHSAARARALDAYAVARPTS